MGPLSFLSTLNELKSYLKFNLTADGNLLSLEKLKDFDIFICHRDYANKPEIINVINELKCVKIIAGKKKDKSKYFDEVVYLPASINEINNIVESSAAKREFSKNSSIKIKSYFLDKNEKKLSRDGISIILTEKEIQLLELFLGNRSPVSKNTILSKVWHYSSDADTHTVETHIYRLRKKINQSFSDNHFIQINKTGYYL